MDVPAPDVTSATELGVAAGSPVGSATEAVRRLREVATEAGSPVASGNLSEQWSKSMSFHSTHLLGGDWNMTG